MEDKTNTRELHFIVKVLPEPYDKVFEFSHPCQWTIIELEGGGVKVEGTIKFQVQEGLESIAEGVISCVKESRPETYLDDKGTEWYKDVAVTEASCELLDQLEEIVDHPEERSLHMVLHGIEHSIKHRSEKMSPEEKQEMYIYLRNVVEEESKKLQDPEWKNSRRFRRVLRMFLFT